MRNRKCSPLDGCMWDKYEFEYDSTYSKLARQAWEEIKIERENCPKNCEQYLEAMEAKRWWDQKKKEPCKALESKK